MNKKLNKIARDNKQTTMKSTSFKSLKTGYRLYLIEHDLIQTPLLIFSPSLILYFVFYYVRLSDQNYCTPGRWHTYLILLYEARACCKATLILAPSLNNESYKWQTKCDSSSSSSSQKDKVRSPFLSGSLSSQSLTGLLGMFSSSASSSPISNFPFSTPFNSL